MKKVLSLVFLAILIVSINKLTAQSVGKFNNPILAGFYPDPSICKVGEDYYLVNSTFAYFPGIPIFHSKDLTSWEQIGSVLDRPEQLNLDGMGVSRGIFAPAIRYFGGTFYVTCTLVDGGGNFIVTATNPAGPWSNPVWLPEVNGIDPSLYFEEDGSAYLLYNSDAPENKPLYDGHRTIRLYKFDCDVLKVVGENKILINGGVDISKKPVWIEGPHIYKVNNYYYLTAAEGGTAEDHSQVVFRSEKVDGPYIPYEKNPILTQRNLDPKRKFPVTCTGHSDFVQTDNGSWWAVFLGCRPYEPFEENFYNTGRETFLAPVKWKDGYPVINPDFDEVQYSYSLPMQPKEKVEIPLNGNFTLRENFDSETLPLYWTFLRTVREKWFDLSERKGFLKLNVRPEKISDAVNPSFICRRQQHSKGYASLALDFKSKSENEKAGLVVFLDEGHFYYLCKSKAGDDEVIQLYKSSQSKIENNMELLASQAIEKSNSDEQIYLKIEMKGKEFAFYFGYEPDDWKLVKDNIDATYLSIRVSWGFVGSMFAMYATSLGDPSDNAAYFDWFEYNGNDDVYKMQK